MEEKVGEIFSDSKVHNVMMMMTDDDDDDEDEDEILLHAHAEMEWPMAKRQLCRYQNERLCLAMYVHVQGNAQYVHTYIRYDSTMTPTRAG